MSFILDALRKSERERQRDRSPEVASAGPIAAPRSRGLWLPLVALLVGLNVSLVLVVVWFMGSGADAQPPAPAAAATRPVPPPVVRAEGERSLQRELESAPAQPAAAATRPAVSTPATPAATPPAAPSPARGAKSDAAAERSYPPTLTELTLDGALNLPPLRIDLHVYSAVPAERFVFINNARYAEGERLGEGPVIREITDIGVVMNHEGRDFLLTRD